MNLIAILPLLLYFCNKAALPLVNELDTKPLSKHSLTFDLILSCKLLKFFSQNHWTKSGPDHFKLVFYQESSSNSPWLYYLLQFGYIISTIFHSYYLPTHSICLLKAFAILQHLADHHYIFLLPDSIPSKTALYYSETLFCFV